MPRIADRSNSTRPRCDLLRLSDPLLASAIQLLIALHPELLLPPGVPVLHPSPRLQTARVVVALCGELLAAFQRYHAATEPSTQLLDLEPHDDELGEPCDEVSL